MLGLAQQLLVGKHDFPCFVLICMNGEDDSDFRQSKGLRIVNVFMLWWHSEEIDYGYYNFCYSIMSDQPL